MRNVEEKKMVDPIDRSIDSKSTHSYKSTHSSRSSVLERAREYNRRIDEQNKRSKSLERPDSGADSGSDIFSEQSRSLSAGRAAGGPRLTTRERAMASVRNDKPSSKATAGTGGSTQKQASTNGSSRNSAQQAQQRRPVSQVTDNTHPLTPSSQYSQSMVSPTSPVQSQPPSSASYNRPSQTSNNTPRSQQQQHSVATRNSNMTSNNSRGRPSSSSQSQQPRGEQQGQPVAVVTPELLVDALSGHEDGLLAIAERLMEHYDSGYDVMGEAIIDAFADVQKLFQHVVEAAHMEGAAFEASRRETEMEELRAAAAENGNSLDDLVPVAATPTAASTPTGPARHDEFIDQDVKDVLTDAIRKGSAMRDANQHMECLHLYEQACHSASSLLPVDSDHRGRLQLSIARAESMSADRACAILRYAMDDVLRSGMRAVKTPLPDPSQRADVVLSRPHHSVLGGSQVGVIQSADEALASLMEEMKEILNAPIYNDTPLQSVARRFWTALSDAQKMQQKNEEKLEQNLAKLKGEFLLARAEWEEKLNQTNETAESFKTKYEALKDQLKGGEDNMHTARARFQDASSNSNEDGDNSFYGSVKQAAAGRAGSVASLGSGLAQHAKTVVNSLNSFNCNAMNERSSPAASPEVDIERRRNHPSGTPNRGHHYRDTPSAASALSKARSSTRNSAHGQHNRPSSRTFREYSKSPHRMDV
jgi:hypothetical protein